jgi:hypothetical protein
MCTIALLIAFLLSSPLAAETVRLGDRFYEIELPARA